MLISAWFHSLSLRWELISFLGAHVELDPNDFPLWVIHLHLVWPLSLYITYQPFLVSPEQFLMQLALYPKQTNIHQLASHWSVFSLGHNLSLSKTSYCVWSFGRTFISTLLGRKYHLMVITLKFKNWFSPKASAIQFTQ